MTGGGLWLRNKYSGRGGGADGAAGIRGAGLKRYCDWKKSFGLGGCGGGWGGRWKLSIFLLLLLLLLFLNLFNESGLDLISKSLMLGALVYSKHLLYQCQFLVPKVQLLGFVHKMLNVLKN